MLSDDNDEVAFWNLDRRHLQARSPLRAGTTAVPRGGEPSLTEAAGDERGDPASGGGFASPGGSTSATTRATGAAASTARRFGSRRVALAGNYVAVLLPG